MIKLASILFIIVMSFLSGTLGLWVADREPPVSDIRYIADLEKTAVPGGTFTFTGHVNRRRICVTTSERMLIARDGRRWRLPANVYQVPGDLGDEEYKVTINIPTDMPPGPTVLRSYVAWQCNPWHVFYPIIATLPEVAFTVEPRK